MRANTGGGKGGGGGGGKEGSTGRPGKAFVEAVLCKQRCVVSFVSRLTLVLHWGENTQWQEGLRWGKEKIEESGQ